MPIYKPNKPYTQDINDLVVQDEMLKGKALPAGTTRNWSGVTYVKQGNGDWTPVAAAKNETPVVEQPTHSNKAPAESKDGKAPSSNQVNNHEKSALKEYQSGMHGSALGGYANLQFHLREGKPQFGTFTPEEAKLADEVVAHVSSAIKKHPITEPTTVYRGLKVKKNEVLLDKNTKFKVVSVKDSGTHRKLVIQIVD